jgi:micrococcal nuclease
MSRQVDSAGQVTYEVDATLKRIVDGDTMEFLVDPGFDVQFTITVRVKNIDTPETYRPSCEAEKLHGEKASKRAKELLTDPLTGEPVPVKLISYKRQFDRGFYSRYLVHIILPDGRDYGDVMREEGLEKLDTYASM